MAYLVKTSGVVERVENPSLEKLQELVGGYIEGVASPTGELMYANEEGRIRNLPLNHAIYFSTGIHLFGDVVVMEPGDLE
jgi:hypothetical protein